MAERKETETEYDSDMPDDEDLDDELQLPEKLRDISVQEKRALYLFKVNKSEIEWEMKMTEMQEGLSRQIDLERLKRMASTSAGDDRDRKGRAQKTVPSSRGRKRHAAAVEDEEEDEGEGEEERQATQAPGPSRTTSRRGASAAAAARIKSDLQAQEEKRKVKRRAGAKSKSAKTSRRSRKRGWEDDEDDDDEDDDSEVEVAGKMDVVEDGEEVEEGEIRDDDSEDLFDSDEEEELSSKFKKPAPGQKDESRLRKGAAIDTKSWSMLDEDDGDNYASGGEEVFDDGGYSGYKSGKAKVATAHSEGGALKSAVATARERIQAEGDEEDDTPMAGLASYLKIQLRRSMIETALNEPFFEAYVVGKFVRYSLADRGDGICIYRMAEISAVTTGSRYKFASSMGGKQIETSRYFDLAIAGAVKRRCRIDRVSNSRITEHEFKGFMERCSESRSYKPLTEKQVHLRREDARAVVTHHQYTNEEIQEMVHRSHGLDMSVTSGHAIAMHRLLAKKEKARLNNDYQTLEEAQKAIEKLNAVIQSERRLFESTNNKHISLNMRNKNANFQKDFEAGNVKLGAKGTLAVTQTQNPFVRRETRPKILWKTGSRLEQDKRREKLAQDIKRLKDEGDALGAAQLEAELATLTSASISTTSTGASAAATTTAAAAGGEKKDEEDGWRIEHSSLNEIRRRVTARLGVDPYTASKESRRERYLRQVCASLPALGSEEREKLRRGISLMQFWKEREETAITLNGAPQEDSDVVVAVATVGGTTTAVQ